MERILASLLIVFFLFSCNDSDTIENSTATTDTEVDSANKKEEEKPERRSNLLNSSEEIIKAHAKTITQVYALKDDKAAYKKKRQNKRTEKKIKDISNKIRRKRIEIRTIEENDVIADEIDASKRQKFTSLSYELLKAKSKKDEYAHRSDPIAKKAKKNLDNKINKLQKEIDLLID